VKPRTLLILFALVLGLGAFIQFYERKLPSSEERAKAGDRILDVSKDDVQAVEIVRNGQTVRLERVKPAAPAKPAKVSKEKDAAAPEPAQEWRLTLPRAARTARADATAVAGLVESLTSLARTRTLEKADPKAVGLDPPQATVRLTTSQGERVLSIGAKVPTGSEVIVGVKGDRDAYVTTDAILSSLERDPGEWRDRQMLAAEREKIDRITLSGPAGTTVLARQGDGFVIVSPVSGVADRDLVEGLLTDLTGLHAQQFLDDPKETPAALGLEPPRGVIEVVVRGGAPQRIEIGGPAPSTVPPAQGAPGTPPTPGAPEAAPAGPNVYARVAGQALIAQTGLGADVTHAPADWRSRALSRFQVYQVESARVDDASGTVTVTRAGTDWKRGQDTISYTPVSDLLFAVVGGKATRLLTPEEAAATLSGKPRVTVTLKAEKNGGEETVAIYPAGSEGAPVRTSGRDGLLLLPSDKLVEVEKQIAAIRAAVPLPPEKPVATGKKSGK
jgi:hypothetical protein